MALSLLEVHSICRVQVPVGSSCATGGVIALVKRELLPVGIDPFPSRELVPGQDSYPVIPICTDSICSFNVNHIASVHAGILRVRCALHSRRARLAGSLEQVTVVGGGFNFLASGESSWSSVTPWLSRALLSYVPVLRGSCVSLPPSASDAELVLDFALLPS